MTNTVKRFRFDTDGFPTSCVDESIRDIQKQYLIEFDIKRLDDTPPRSTADVFQLPEITFSLTENTPMFLRTGPEEAFPDDIYMTLVLSGGGAGVYDRWEGEVKPGEAIFNWAGKGFSVRQPQTTRLINMRLPLQTLTKKVNILNEASVKVVDARHPALNLLAAYVSALTNSGFETVDDQALIAANTRHLCDIVAMALGPTGDTVHAAKGESIPAMRLALAKEFVRKNLHNPRLGEDMLSRELGVSASYIRKLFSLEGTALASYIRAERLEAAMAYLRSPRRDALRIIDVAGQFGFNDLSTFNRAFRRQFGCSPGEAHFRR